MPKYSAGLHGLVSGWLHFGVSHNLHRPIPSNLRRSDKENASCEPLSILKMIILPRQARDKRRGNFEKDAFLQELASLTGAKNAFF
jgi:hypothetical protein